MTVEVDHYIVQVKFKRLFADPRIFGPEVNLPRLFLDERGFDKSKERFIIELGHFRVTDGEGNTAKSAGTAKYDFQGKKTNSEYMESVTLAIEYYDLGTRVPPYEHHRFWMDGPLWTMRFTLEKFDHETVTLDIPDISELYTMVKNQAQPTTMASVELGDLPNDKFDLALAYLETSLRSLAEKDNLIVEVYPARYMDSGERKALDARLARESTDSTVYMVLGGHDGPLR